MEPRDRAAPVASLPEGPADASHSRVWSSASTRANCSRVALDIGVLLARAAPAASHRLRYCARSSSGGVWISSFIPSLLNPTLRAAATISGSAHPPASLGRHLLLCSESLSSDYSSRGSARRLGYLRRVDKGVPRQGIRDRSQRDGTSLPIGRRSAPGRQAQRRRRLLPPRADVLVRGETGPRII